jgi:hypothetical protein
MRQCGPKACARVDRRGDRQGEKNSFSRRVVSRYWSWWQVLRVSNAPPDVTVAHHEEEPQRRRLPAMQAHVKSP